MYEIVTFALMIFFQHLLDHYRDAAEAGQEQDAGLDAMAVEGAEESRRT